MEQLGARVALMRGLVPIQYVAPYDGEGGVHVLPGFLMLAHVNEATKDVSEVLIEPMELWGRDVSDLGAGYMLKRLQDSNETSAQFGPDKRNTALWFVGTFAKGIPMHMSACTLENISSGFIDDGDSVSRFPNELMRASLANLQEEFSALSHLDQVKNPADAPLARHFSALHDMLALSQSIFSGYQRDSEAYEEALAVCQDMAQRRFEKAQADANKIRKAAVAAKNLQIQSLEQALKKQRSDAATAQREARDLAQSLRAQLAALSVSDAPAASVDTVTPLAPQPAAPSMEPEDDEEQAHWRETAEHQAEVIRQLRLALQYVPAKEGSDPAPQAARKLADLPDWAAENADRVIVLKRAMHAVKKCNFEDQEFIFKALDMLATTYRDVKLGLVDRMAYSKACEELGLDMGGSIAEAPSEDYFFQWKGRRTFLDQHIGRGISRDPRYCFRCYFTWDEEEAKVVIGWLPSHLPTRTT